MRQGDLLLIRHQYDPLGWLIRKVTKSEWNHIAWAMNSHWLIESKGTGIVMSSIRKFQNKRLYKIKLIRIKDLSKSKIKKVSEILYRRRCRWNYFTFLLTYLLTICGSKYRPCMSCSWFIADGLRIAGYRITKQHLRYVTPEDFCKWNRCEDVTDELCSGCPGV
jgi:hypothetical protein